MVNKKTINIALCILLILGIFNSSPVFALTTSIETTRLAGNDRYATSVAVSQAGWTLADTVIISTGLNYPDALAASALTKSKNAPILLTNPNAMDQAVINEIKRLNSTKAILVGGTGVIGTGVENQLKVLGLSISRINGSNRYDTSVKIADMIGTGNGIIVATGSNFPDALSIAPIAAIKSIPIILSPSSSLDQNVSTFLAGKSVPVSYIIGGTTVLSDSLALSLPNSKRLSGSDRYTTNLKIVNEFSADLNFDTVYLATGLNFPDALSGSAIAAKNNSPIILTGKDSISQDTINFIKSKGVKHIVILGGTSVVSQNVVDAINGIIHPSSVSLNKTSLNLIAGDTYTLSATVSPSNATNQAVTWTSSNGNASVDNSGKITALRAGTATITARTTDGNLAASCNVTISNINIQITSLDLSGETVTIKNYSNRNQNMTGWKLVSVDGNQTYYFPTNYILSAGSTITIASGKATGDLKWTTAYIWNNNGDKAELYNSVSTLISSK